VLSCFVTKTVLKQEEKKTGKLEKKQAGMFFKVGKAVVVFFRGHLVTPRAIDVVLE
jgi:hypothetical protein